MSDTTEALPPLFPPSGDPAMQVRAVVWSRQARPLGGLHAWLTGAMITFAVADFLLILFNGGVIWLMSEDDSGREFSDFHYFLYDLLNGYAGAIAGIVFFVAYLLAGFLYCRFIYRAIENLDLSHARGDRVSPGWAVAYNFIPIMNLWKPVQAMSQAWRGSLDPEQNRIGPPASTGLWWATWLISGVVSNFSLQLGLSSGGYSDVIIDFDEYTLSLWLEIIASIVGILSVIFLLPIISGITRAQDARTLRPASAAA